MGTSDTALILQRLLAITDTGLSFAASDFDRERYADIRDNLNQLLSEISHLEPDELSDLLRPTDFYATPLVDVRSFYRSAGEDLSSTRTARGDMGSAGWFLRSRPISQRKYSKRNSGRNRISS